MVSDLTAALNEARRALLDLSTRNRLLALPKPGRSRGVVIMDDEDADFLLGALLAGRAFAFEASGSAPSVPPDTGAAADAPNTKPRRTPKRAPRAEKSDGVGTAKIDATREEWQRDDRLRIRLPAADLARRLRDLMQDARTTREETGIASLYLAVGALAWRDPGTPETERLAPLALLPVTLEREGVSQVFRLRAAVNEVSENLSLREMLATSFRITLPEFDPETYDPTQWAEAVGKLLPAGGGWHVDPDSLALGLFSFAKFLMWRDLDPAVNPGLLTHPVVRSLVGGDALEAANTSFPDDADVDQAIPVEALDHVVDVDGSQALAAEAVRRGGHLVIQGPPGTGKSQTITNILGQAVLDAIAMPPPGSADTPRRIPGAALHRPGTMPETDVLLAQGWTLRPVTVLFVAEKLAALEVVKRRLENIGLGAACLELHSEKQSKRAVLDDLRATLAIPAAPAPERKAVVDRLGALRSRLNRHAAAMREDVGVSGIPLHRVLGVLVALRAKGVGAPDFALNPTDWDGATIAARRRAVAALVTRAREGGPNSVWRGVRKEIGALDTERLLSRLPVWIRAMAGAEAALESAVTALGREAPGPAQARDVLGLAEAVAAAPRHDPEAMADAAWQADPAPLRALLEAATRLAATGADVRLKAGALDRTDLAQIRTTLADGGGIFGFLSGARRAAKAMAAEIVRDAADPLPALDAALAGQAVREKLREGDALGRAAFGTLWAGENSDIAALSALLDWRLKHGPAAAVALAARMPRPDEITVRIGVSAFDELVATTDLDPLQAFGAPPSFRALSDRLAGWAGAPEALSLWQGWRRAVADASDLVPIVERLTDGRLVPEAATDAFDAALNEALLRDAMRARPELAGFDGTAADRLVTEFRNADIERVKLARAEAGAAHALRLKSVRDGMSGYTVIKGEMEKRRGHLPVRELLSRAGQAVQTAKPIFMMSPLSVAQFLSPPHGLRPGISFDLVVMDEASQVEPVDALGPILRARQVVVVGDDKQMPPTRFFQRMTGEEDDDTAPEDAPDAVAARDVESILGLANARGVPSAMLRWHYRSRHESLIATSNAAFYENRLLVLPSPRPRSAELGLSLIRVDGQWDSGGSGTNRAEAEAIAQAAIQHAKTSPGDTLGIAAFSIRQRDAILDAVEALRRDNPDTDDFFNGHAAEPFFVKNLENVQGDERDAMFISVGYGRGADGKMAMRFGPLSMAGGERRLNVLITRAKKRCAVFSSIGADDLDLERAGGRGVAVLKTFMEFAAGRDAAPRGGDAGEPSPLADAIARTVRDAGKEAVIRVGTSGVFLDVAARDAGGYVLGVAADGGDWAALRCARDRERGRDGALAGMGWRLMRAWSLAWLSRPEAEAARLQAALGAAPADAVAPALAAADTGLSEPYREATVEVPKDKPIDDPSIGFAALSEILAAIIRIEQPISADAVLERARLLWNDDFLSPSERAALTQGLRLAAQLQGVKEIRGFWVTEDAPRPVPRDRRATAPHLRHAAAVSPEEIAVAAERLLEIQPRATESEIVAGVHRMLGLETTALAAVEARIAALVGGGRIKPTSNAAMG